MWFVQVRAASYINYASISTRCLRVAQICTNFVDGYAVACAQMFKRCLCITSAVLLVRVHARASASVCTLRAVHAQFMTLLQSVYMFVYWL